MIAGLMDWPAVPEHWPASSWLNKLEYKLGLDLQGGTHLVYEADTSGIELSDRESTIAGVRDVIEKRVNAFGVAEPLVQTNQSGDTYRVIVELAGVFDVNEAIDRIGQTPLLEFKEQNTDAPTPLTSEEQKEMADYNTAARAKAEEALSKARAADADFAVLAAEYSEDPGSKEKGGEIGFVARGVLVPEYEKAIFDDLHPGDISLIQSPFGFHVIQKIEERSLEGTATGVEVNSRHILVRTKSESDFRPAQEPWKNTLLSGKHLERATVQFEQTTGEPEVSLEFNNEGGDLFAQITERNVGKPVAIFLDGNPLSIPTVQSKITAGTAVITGSFTVQEARSLAQNLNAGALPVPIHLLSQQTVGPSLGQEALVRSLRAGVAGFLLVAIFMIIFYRLPGLISVIALGVYTILSLFVFQLFSITLTLSGIAGFILSIGMAVDANILIFERLKEELARGRTLGLAVEEGFKRAWTSIRDSNSSSLITCLILFWFGTGVVKGFAVTLALGILVSMFSAITLTRGMLRAVVGARSSEKTWLFGARRHEAVENSKQ